MRARASHGGGWGVAVWLRGHRNQRRDGFLVRPGGYAEGVLRVPWFLRHDVHVHRRRFTQEPVNDGKVQILAPIPDGRAAEDDLRNVLSADEVGDGIRDA